MAVRVIDEVELEANLPRYLRLALRGYRYAVVVDGKAGVALVHLNSLEHDVGVRMEEAARAALAPEPDLPPPTPRRSGRRQPVPAGGARRLPDRLRPR